MKSVRLPRFSPFAPAEQASESEDPSLFRAERLGGAFQFWYAIVSVLWILGTDALMDRIGNVPVWVGSLKDILYLVVSGVVIRQVVTLYLSNLRRAHLEQMESKRELAGRLAMAAEYRDDETGGHNHRIARTAQILGREMGLGPAACERLFYAASLHDLGKIAVPDGILHKNGALDADERAAMQRHAQLGAALLANSRHPLLQISHDVAISHHERWDGTGYPRGLRGEDIPLEGRIVAVCDVFDALLSQRPYKPAWPLADAVAEIRHGRGSHFDPRVVDAFLRCLPALVAVREEAHGPWSPSSNGEVLAA